MPDPVTFTLAPPFVPEQLAGVIDVVEIDCENGTPETAKNSEFGYGAFVPPVVTLVKLIFCRVFNLSVQVSV